MKYGRIALLIMAAAMMLALVSCEDLMNMLFGDTVTVTIAQRITAFETTLNGADRTGILDHLHVNMASRQQVAALDYWELGQLAYDYAPFTFGTPTVDENGVATCTYDAGNGTGEIVFTMALEGTEYKILKLVLTIDGVSAPPYELKRLFAIR